jgi:hypothetical protein
LRHLIVVVPGIGGSVLADERMRPVWGDARRRVVQLLADPGRLSLAEAPGLHPVALMASAGHIPPFRLHGYDGLVRATGGAGAVGVWVLGAWAVGFCAVKVVLRTDAGIWGMRGSDVGSGASGVAAQASAGVLPSSAW